MRFRACSPRLTGPESRIMPDGANEGSFVQGCNAQIAADAASQQEASREKLRAEAERALYKMRKAIVEPVFGWTKEQRSFRRFILGGKENVSREWKLVCGKQPAEAVPDRRGSANGIKRREKGGFLRETAQKACYKLSTGLLPVRPGSNRSLANRWIGLGKNTMPDIHINNAVIVDPAQPAPSWLTPFEPRHGLANSHLQTIVGNFLPRQAFRLDSVSETVEVDPADGSRMLCHCHWQPENLRGARLTVLLVHGLEGSSDSRYIQGIAARAWAAGCNVIRMNMRTCGGTETLTPTLYHSGLSGDVGVVVDHYARRFGLGRVALAGYSMGGNLVLKLDGEWGKRPPLCAVAAVCPAIDLAPGADALHEPLNRAYEWRFLRGLMARYSRKAKLFPGIYASRKAIGPVRSIREFDNKIVARYWGFRDADDYYDHAASARVVDKIAVPTLVLRALDDPFIRLLPETRSKLLANPHIALVETRHGGHCAFLSRDPGNEIHWAEATVMRFLLAAAGESDGS